MRRFRTLASVSCHSASRSYRRAIDSNTRDTKGELKATCRDQPRYFAASSRSCSPPSPRHVNPRRFVQAGGHAIGDVFRTEFLQNLPYGFAGPDRIRSHRGRSPAIRRQHNLEPCCARRSCRVHGLLSAIALAYRRRSSRHRVSQEGVLRYAKNGRLNRDELVCSTWAPLGRVLAVFVTPVGQANGLHKQARRIRKLLL